MSVSHPTPPPAPITERIARNGLFLGIYICVLVVATGLSTRYAAASIVVWVGSLGMPFFVYRLIRRNHLGCRRPNFPELWAEGIGSFFLATLLPALLTYVLLRFVAPTFIIDTLEQSVVVLRSLGTPQWDEMASAIELLITRHKVPTAADVTSQIISTNIIVGTVISLIVSIFIVLKNAVGSHKDTQDGRQNC